MKRLVLALFFSLSVGCSLLKPKIVTAPCPPPPVVQRPDLITAKLPPTASIVEVLEAYVLDLIAMNGYARKLDALLDAYRVLEKPTKPKPEPPK